MKAATIHAGGSLPELHEVSSPKPSSSQIQLKVESTAIHHLVRARALGKHYSTSKVSSRYSNEDTVIGVDGVGSVIDGPDKGQLYYFTSFEPDNGSFVETVTVEKENIYPIKGKLSYDSNGNLIEDEVWDTVKRISVLANSAMASFLALDTKKIDINKNSTVLINGVTGSSGQIAVDILQKSFGVAKVIGVGRNRNKLKEDLNDKLIEYISIENLTDDEIVDTLQHYQDIEIVLDFTWGDQALRLLQDLISSRYDSSKVLNWIQIGQIGGSNISIPGGLLRGNNLRIMGSGIGSFNEQEGKGTFKLMIDDLSKGEIGKSVYENIDSANINHIHDEWIQWKPDLRKAFTFNSIE